MAEIKTYNAAALSALIKSEWFRTSALLPISTQRAISQINNPRVLPGDILLIAQFEGEQLQGYLGILPDTIRNSALQEFHCGWLSCLWIDERLRGKGIAKKLLQAMFTSWNNNVLVTEFTPEAKGLYDRSGNMETLQINEGLRAYLRFDFEKILTSKFPKLQPIHGIFRITDRFLNSFVNFRLKFMQSKKTTWTEVENIDEELHQFIAAAQQHSFAGRTAAEFQWIRNFPWLKESKPDNESRRYYFSSVASRFENRWFKLKSEENIAAFIFASIRNGHLRIPYFFAAEGLEQTSVRFIFELMRKENCSMLSVFDERLVKAFQKTTLPFLHRRELKREYMISKSLKQNFDGTSAVIRDGDGDAAFT